MGSTSSEDFDRIGTTNMLSVFLCLNILEDHSTGTVLSLRTQLSDTAFDCQMAQLDGNCGTKQMPCSNPPAKPSPRQRFSKRSKHWFGRRSFSDDLEKIELEDCDKNKDSDRMSVVSPRPTNVSVPSDAIPPRRISLSSLKRRATIRRRSTRSGSSHYEEQGLTAQEFFKIEQVAEQDGPKVEVVLPADIEKPERVEHKVGPVVPDPRESNYKEPSLTSSVGDDDGQEPPASAFRTPATTWAVEGQRRRSCCIARHSEEEEQRGI